jgi:putative Holliday junction resolvase
MTAIRRILAIDYGKKRIGLAFYDRDLGVPLPIAPIIEASEEAQLRKIMAEAQRREVELLLLGIPLLEHPSNRRQRLEFSSFGEKLSDLLGIPLRYQDEYLSSGEAERRHFSLHPPRNLGESMAMRRSGRIDSIAALVILEDFLLQPKMEGNGDPQG